MSGLDVRGDRRAFVAHLSTAAAASLFVPARVWAALESDEGVVVLPSTARRLDDGRIELRVQAWVYEREGRRLAARALAKLIGLDLDEIDAAERRRFVERTALFAREAQARRRLRLELTAGPAGVPAAAPWFDLPASRRDGSVDAALPLQPDAVSRDATGAISFELVAGPAPGPSFDTSGRSERLPRSERRGGGPTPSERSERGGNGPRRFAGRAYLSGSVGLSIVSDIDDTIKHTQVRDRRQMLLNTFARPMTAVPGMADWYAQVAQAARLRGEPAAFHFVSSAPWPLASALDGFLHEHAFPAGSLHLRAFSLEPQALLSRSASPAHKHTTIERLLADQPRRRFVLIGDSGEQDPEIYGAITRRHPERIAAILVRDVTGDRADGERYARALVGVARERWSIFDDPSRLPRRWD